MTRFTLAVLVVAILAVPGVSLARGPKAPRGTCTPHNVRYRVAGTVVSGSLTPTGKHTYSGSLVVQVTKASKAAKAATGTQQTYTLTNTRVRLHGEDPAALTADSRVRLEGKITALGKKCDQTGFTATVTIRKGSIKPPKPA